MSALVVDTSSWISYFASHAGAEIIEAALQEGRVHLPPGVVAELNSGKLAAAKRAALLDFLSDLPLCGADFGHWVRVGALRSQLLARGLSVSTPDAHIAQCAIDLEAELLSEDRIFHSVAAQGSLRLV